jgi:hypothetical protein
MASLTVLTELPAPETQEVWSQLKPVNREFVEKQIQRRTWDFAVDVARFSVATLQSTSANDLMMQEALQDFNATALRIRDQLLEAFDSSHKQYGQNILEDLNRHLGIVHQRLEVITRENGALNPAVRESLASMNSATSAIGSLLASLKIPSIKGDIGETNVLDSMRAAFLGIPSVSIEPLGGSGNTDIIIHFDQNGIEIGKVLVESKNRETWSNSFLAQLERDMGAQGALFGILATTALPKDAKSRGYTIADRNRTIIITTPDLASAVVLIIYDLVQSLERLTGNGQTLQALLRSRELHQCLMSNLSLVDPLKNVIRIMDKAHADMTSSINSIIEAIQRNNSRLAEGMQPAMAQEQRTR